MKGTTTGRGRTGVPSGGLPALKPLAKPRADWLVKVAGIGLGFGLGNGSCDLGKSISIHPESRFAQPPLR